VLWGNACVALLVAAVLPFGALLAGAMPAPVWMAAGICFAYILAQEALFTLEDETADRAAGLRTTATVLGTEAAARLVRGLLATFFIVALSPWVAGQAPLLYAAMLAAVSLAPGLVLVAWLRSPVEPARVARAARLSRWIWLTSFLPLAMLR
jgi:4-hydroxybenzoate polyprenyltransferase